MPANPQKTTVERPWKDPRATPQLVIENLSKSYGGFLAVDSVDDLPFGVPDDQVTTRIDGTAYLDAKVAALRAHASQIAVDSPFFALSDRVGQRAFGVEYYTLLAGPRGDGAGPNDWEADLFAGLAGLGD